MPRSLTVRAAARGEVVRESARNDFKQHKYVSDPEQVARLLVHGNDMLMEIQHQVCGMIIVLLHLQVWSCGKVWGMDPTFRGSGLCG